MKILELDNQEAERIFNALLNKQVVINDDYFAGLSNDYKNIRYMFLRWIKEKKITKTYEFDLFLALKIHQYFNQGGGFPDFNEAVASNYGFWKYICLKVIPDIIIERHGLVKEYFYAKNLRIYVSTLWWYIEMCFQGTYATTYDCLKDKSTDYILQIVERPGRNGMFVEVFRLVVYVLSKLPKEEISKKYNNQSLLRRVVIQNTAKGANFNLVIEGKAKEYVIGLFKSCGVEVEKYVTF